MTITEDELEKLRRWKKRVVIWIVIFTGLVMWGVYQNKQRINDIQKSRVYSCQQNYLRTRGIFKPFFPPKSKRSDKQKADIKRFIHQTDPRQCFNQVKPK